MSEYIAQLASRTPVTILNGLVDEWWELDCLVSKNATECKKSLLRRDILSLRLGCREYSAKSMTMAHKKQQK